MKKWIAIMCIVSLCLVGLVGCDKGGSNTSPAEPTPQEVADAARAEVSMPEYEFFWADAPQGEDPADEETSRYLRVVLDGENVDTIYNYRDFSYDEESCYRYFDLYTDVPLSELSASTPVFVYLHGGSWVGGSRHGDGGTVCSHLVKQGYAVVSMEYALLFGLNQIDSAEKGVEHWTTDEMLAQLLNPQIVVTFEDMMDDVRTLLNCLHDVYFPRWGLTATKVGFGGYSAGGHLSSLYAYKYNDAKLKAAFLVSIAGPVHFLDESYLRVYAKIMERPIMAGMLTTFAETLGLIFDSEPVDMSTPEGYELAVQLIHTVQPVDYITADSIPTVLSYGGYDETDNVYDEDFYTSDPINFEAPSDSLIPVSVFRTICALLEQNGVVHFAHLWPTKSHVHTADDEDSCRWMAECAKVLGDIYLR